MNAAPVSNVARLTAHVISMDVRSFGDGVSLLTDKVRLSETARKAKHAVEAYIATFKSASDYAQQTDEEIAGLFLAAIERRKADRRKTSAK